MKARKINVARAVSRVSKYRNRVTNLDGIRFASEAEARRYSYLKIRLRIGEISDLELQPKFPIAVNDKRICNYIADFRYKENATGKVVVEDVKGVKTPLYKLKKKLVEALYGVSIIEK